MTKHKIAEINMGDNLDNLMNLDPREYGVSRILYSKSRELAGEPLSMHAANFLVKNVTEGDIIYILTGFILWPHKVPEMDGLVSAVLLARSLIKAFDAKPIIICPMDCKKAVEKCSNVVGLHSYQELQVVMELPLSMGIVTFSKNVIEAKQQTEDLLSNYFPKTVISIEAPGANSEGEYHNAIGRNVSDM